MSGTSPHDPDSPVPEAIDVDEVGNTAGDCAQSLDEGRQDETWSGQWGSQDNLPSELQGSLPKRRCISPLEPVEKPVRYKRWVLKRISSYFVEGDCWKCKLHLDRLQLFTMNKLERNACLHIATEGVTIWTCSHLSTYAPTA